VFAKHPDYWNPFADALAGDTALAR
jgi:hypothetical protein